MVSTSLHGARSASGSASRRQLRRQPRRDGSLPADLTSWSRHEEATDGRGRGQRDPEAEPRALESRTGIKKLWPRCASSARRPAVAAVEVETPQVTPTLGKIKTSTAPSGEAPRCGQDRRQDATKAVEQEIWSLREPGRPRVLRLQAKGAPRQAQKSIIRERIASTRSDGPRGTDEIARSRSGPACFPHARLRAVHARPAQRSSSRLAPRAGDEVDTSGSRPKRTSTTKTSRPSRSGRPAHARPSAATRSRRARQRAWSR